MLPVRVPLFPFKYNGPLHTTSHTSSFTDLEKANFLFRKLQSIRWSDLEEMAGAVKVSQSRIKNEDMKNVNEGKNKETNTTTVIFSLQTDSVLQYQYPVEYAEPTCQPN